MKINWEEVLDGASPADFKAYAPQGEYEVQLEKVAVRDKEGWKSPMVTFQWATDEYKYPNSTAHWLSLAKPNWRVVHFMVILMEFGLPEAKAKELIELAEKNDDRAKLVAAYQHIFDLLAQRKPKVRVIVKPQTRDGRPVISGKGTPLTESDFANSNLRLGGEQSAPAAESVAGTVADSLVGELDGEEPLNLTEIPF